MILTETTITVTTPELTIGEFDVVVTATGGSATATNGFRAFGIPTVTSVSPARLAAALNEHGDKGDLMESRKAFAEKMRRKNAIPVGSDDEILVTNGGTHGLFAAFQTILEPGDEVIIPDPEWPPTMAIVKQAGGSIAIRSAPAEGTTMSVFLPHATDVPAAAPLRQEAPVAPGRVAISPAFAKRAVTRRTTTGLVGIEDASTPLGIACAGPNIQRTSASSRHRSQLLVHQCRRRDFLGGLNLRRCADNAAHRE